MRIPDLLDWGGMDALWFDQLSGLLQAVRIINRAADEPLFVNVQICEGEKVLCVGSVHVFALISLN